MFWSFHCVSTSTSLFRAEHTRVNVILVAQNRRSSTTSNGSKFNVPVVKIFPFGSDTKTAFIFCDKSVNHAFLNQFPFLPTGKEIRLTKEGVVSDAALRKHRWKNLPNKKPTQGSKHLVSQKVMCIFMCSASRVAAKKTRSTLTERKRCAMLIQNIIQTITPVV